MRSAVHYPPYGHGGRVGERSVMGFPLLLRNQTGDSARLPPISSTWPATGDSREATTCRLTFACLLDLRTHPMIISSVGRPHYWHAWISCRWIVRDRGRADRAWIRRLGAARVDGATLFRLASFIFRIWRVVILVWW